MKIRVLIDGDFFITMFLAENIPTYSTMVSPLKEAEGLLADGIVADRSVGIRLPMCARGWPCDFWKVGGVLLCGFEILVWYVCEE